MHSWCAVWLSYGITCCTEVEKLWLIDTLRKYYILSVFDELLSSGTMVSSTSRVNWLSIPNVVTLCTIYVPLMGSLFHTYCEVLEFCIRTSWLTLSMPCIVCVLLVKWWYFQICFPCGLLCREHIMWSLSICKCLWKVIWKFCHNQWQILRTFQNWLWPHTWKDLLNWLMWYQKWY